MGEFFCLFEGRWGIWVENEMLENPFLLLEEGIVVKFLDRMVFKHADSFEVGS